MPANPPSTVAVPDPTAVQSSVTLAQEVGITRFDPDYYALQVGNHVLGGGFYATRLYHDLRQENGYVYNVDDTLTSTKTRSVYTVTYGCDPVNIPKARDLIVRDLRAMQTTDVTPESCSRRKPCSCDRWCCGNRARRQWLADCSLAHKSASRSTRRRVRGGPISR